jgi:putative transposase
VNLIQSCVKRLIGTSVSLLCTRFVHWTKPLTSSLPFGTLADLARSKSELIAENALLRQQLIMLKRQVKRPVCTKADRILLVLLARAVRAWKQALVIVQPETLLRWHREAFRLYWKRKSKAHAHKPKVATETIALIREMATKNRRLRCRAHSWGIVETGPTGVQAHDPEIYERSSHTPTTRSEVADLSAHACRADLGV